MLRFNKSNFATDSLSGNFSAKELSAKYNLKPKRIYYFFKKLNIRPNLKKDVKYKESVEYRKKISDKLKGIKRSPEQIQNYKKAAKKRGNNRPKGSYKHSEETKLKIKESNQIAWRDLPENWKKSCILNDEWFKKLRKVDLENLNEWERYVYEVRSLTAKNARKFKKLISGEKNKDNHLDHIFSISDGFLNQIEVEIISHYTNLRYISAKENLQKRNKSSTSIEQLKEKYYASIQK